MKKLTMLFVLTLSLSSAGFAKDASQDQISVTEKKIESLNKNLQCSTDQNCVALPYGHKSCGGPRMYLVVSKTNKKFKEISELTSRLESLEKKHAESSGMVSTCDIAIEPKVQCSNKKCQVANDQP